MLEKEVSSIEFNPESLEIALKDANISQSEFSKIIGFPHRNTVNKIIRKQRTVTATELLRIAAALKKEPKEFSK